MPYFNAAHVFFVAMLSTSARIILTTESFLLYSYIRRLQLLSPEMNMFAAVEIQSIPHLRRQCSVGGRQSIPTA